MEMLPLPEEPKAATGKVEYRPLTPDEIQSVKYVFDACGSALPNPNESVFVGSIIDGKVLGFIVLQMKLHAEPMWIENGHSDTFLPIVKAAEEHILRRCGVQWVYLFAPAGRVSQLAQSMGMGLEPWNVLSKLVVPEIPSKPMVDMLESLPTEGVQ